MHWTNVSRITFGLTFIAIGLIGLASGDFAPVWQPVPDAFPARLALEWFSVVIALACGAGLLARRRADLAALVLLVVLVIWTAVFKVPFIVRAPLEEVSYQSNGENLVLIAAAWVLFCEMAKSRTFPAGAAGVRMAYVLYGLALIAFGLSHFFYLNMTAPLVPNWLPAPVFWAYATGTIYAVCGFAITTSVATRWAALGAAAQITLITLLVWGPMVLAGGMSAMHWQETVVSWALTAAAWVLASGSPPMIAARRAPSRRRR